MKEDVQELYKLKESIDARVKENFGYCPNNKDFNELEKKWRDQELKVCSLYPNEYAEYCNKVYR